MMRFSALNQKKKSWLREIEHLRNDTYWLRWPREIRSASSRNSWNSTPFFFFFSSSSSIGLLSPFTVRGLALLRVSSLAISPLFSSSYKPSSTYTSAIDDTHTTKRLRTRDRTVNISAHRKKDMVLLSRYSQGQGVHILQKIHSVGGKERIFTKLWGIPHFDLQWPWTSTLKDRHHPLYMGHAHTT